MEKLELMRNNALLQKALEQAEKQGAAHVDQYNAELKRRQEMAKIAEISEKAATAANERADRIGATLQTVQQRLDQCLGWIAKAEGKHPINEDLNRFLEQERGAGIMGYRLDHEPWRPR